MNCYFIFRENFDFFSSVILDRNRIRMTLFFSVIFRFGQYFLSYSRFKFNFERALRSRLKLPKAAGRLGLKKQLFSEVGGKLGPEKRL